MCMCTHVFATVCTCARVCMCMCMCAYLYDQSFQPVVATSMCGQHRFRAPIRPPDPNSADLTNCQRHCECISASAPAVHGSTCDRLLLQNKSVHPNARVGRRFGSRVCGSIVSHHRNPLIAPVPRPWLHQADFADCPSSFT